MRRVVPGASVDAMGVDELVTAVAAHRRHMVPLVDELSRSPDACLQGVARLLDDQARHLDRLCAELDEHIGPRAGEPR